MVPLVSLMFFFVCDVSCFWSVFLMVLNVFLV